MKSSNDFVDHQCHNASITVLEADVQPVISDAGQGIEDLGQ